MSPAAKATGPRPVPGRAARLDDEARLARLHLRVGMLTLARSELEDLERRGLLDVGGRASLAEALWRSGESEAASAAARAHLDAGGDDRVAICIAAEAAAADGRPGEARALMDRLGPPDAAALDALFAGLPRRGFWPSAGPDPMTAETLFGEAPPVPSTARRAAATVQPTIPSGSPAGAGPTKGRSVPGPRDVLEATGPGLWTEAPDGQPAPSLQANGHTAPSLDIDALAELARAREELADQPEQALLRMALVLRIDPTLAPAVLDAVSLRREPAAAVIRGDAQRLLGRHLEAEAAFAAAVEALDRGIVRKPS